MPLVRDARTLSSKAICSLRIAMTSFNSFDEDGRVTSVLLHLQHATEMLLKAVLCQHKAIVFDKGTGKSIGFEKCLHLCQANYALSESEAGIFRAINALRDAAQHWFIFVSEDLLYMHTRAAVTAFDAYLQRVVVIALQLEADGATAFDALHVACAIHAGAALFVTTDDRLLRILRRRNDIVA